MKKIISAILLIILVVSILPVSTIAATNFSDVPKNAIYRADLDFITNDSRHILEGYKGKFNPEDALSVAQFIKIAVAASGSPVPVAKKGEKWYVPYINTAKDLGYMFNGELGNCEREITRGEMARIMVRAVERAEGTSRYRDPDKIKFLIKDYDIFTPDLRDYIVKAFDVGLIGGYSDGTFGPDDKFTRAQAVTVIRRLLDPSRRIKLDINSYLEKFTKIYDGISFNSYNDITGKNSVMKLDKAKEFAMKFYNSLVFYLQDGKPHVKGIIPKVPSGFVFYTGIDLNPGNKVYSYSTNNTKKNLLIANQGSFDIKITSSLDRKDIKKILVTVEIRTTEGDSINYADGMFKLSYPEKKLNKIDSHQVVAELTFPKGTFEKW